VLLAGCGAFQSPSPAGRTPGRDAPDTASLTAADVHSAINDLASLGTTMSGADWQPTETQLTELAKLAAARL
jgi:hypothetical protein